MQKLYQAFSSVSTIDKRVPGPAALRCLINDGDGHGQP